MSLRRTSVLVLAASVALVPVACSDDSGDDGGASVDPTACNTSLEVIGVEGATGQFGARMVLAAGGEGDEEMVIAISGFELPDESIPLGDPGAPDDTNVLVLTLTAPADGFADGQTFTDGTVAADGEITSVTFYRGPDAIDLDPVTVTLGEISESTVCGAIETSGTGVQGEFKAERVAAESVPDTPTSADTTTTAGSDTTDTTASTTTAS